MKKGQDKPGPNTQGEGEAAANPISKMRRRELLRLGAIGAGVGIPVVMTLVPRSARAEGSWKCTPGDQAGAQGSWSCQGGRPGWDKKGWREQARDDYSLRDGAQGGDGFIMPGSYEWRQMREKQEEEQRRARGEFNRFGGGGT